MSEIKILHLSDLHFDSSKPKDTEIVLDALWKDLDNFKDIDFILFSGDLVKAGDKKDDFEKAFQFFITPLMEKTDLDEKSFFIAPGNHDIRRSAIDGIIEEGLKARLINRDNLNSFLDKQIEDGFPHIERLNHFNDFKRRFNSENTITSNKLFSTHKINKKNVSIGIACLNTCWRATGIGGGQDKGRLLIGERQIDASLNDLKHCDIKIALYHHSLDWLTEYDQSDAKKLLSREFDFIFCGHLHDPNLELVQSFDNKAVLIQGGCLYHGRSFYNGYSVVCFNVQKGGGTIYLRSYFDDRRVFDKAVNKCEDGEMSIDIFKNHLTERWLTRLQPEHAPILISIIEKREWALKLASQIDDTLNHSQDTYLECSSKSASRTLAKLENLLQLESILNEEEREVLVAAQYLQTLEMLGADLKKAKSILCQAIDNCEDMVTGTLITADAVRPDFDLESSDMKIGNIRCDLLAALLRIGKILNLDREAIANRNFDPPVKYNLGHWQAFLTKKVIVRRGGLVTFHLLISKSYEEQNDLFIRFTALGFEALWQKLRKILTHNGVAISRSPSRITVSPDIGKVSESILKQLKEAIKDAEESIPQLLHLGYFSPSGFILSQIVPLPYSAIANPLTFKMDSDHDYTLILMLMDVDGGYIGQPLKFPFNGRQDIVLSPDDLQQSSTYRWWIMRNDGDSDSTVTTGCIRTLSGEEMTRWEMASESNDEQKRRDVQVNLGLWNDIMTEIGQKIISDHAFFEEMVLAHRGLLLAFEWLKDNSISTSQVDLYRNASAWVRSLFTTNKNKEK